MTYEEAVEKLFNTRLFRNKTKGPRLTRSLLALLGDPDLAFDSVQVAGSNGKGSVATLLAGALEAAGKRVGLFTSPHLDSFCERISVNGELITQNEVAEGLSYLFPLAENAELTFFDYTTLLALHHFSEKKVDVALLEVGLGGRLDATSVVTPILTVITSICLEHTEILGETMEEIAMEKAGIFKKGVPAVIGPTVPKEVVAPAASSLGCSLYAVSGHFPSFEEENRAIATAACKSLTVSLPIVDRIPPCRFEEVQPEVILDVAHNPQALRRLFEQMELRYPARAIRVVAGFGRHKDVRACLEVIGRSASCYHLVYPNHERAADPREFGFEASTSVEETVRAARLQAKSNGEILLICGTFYLMNEARSCL
jgi:dihydrofolate synthase/folylpolyglutamate synthase